MPGEELRRQATGRVWPDQMSRVLLQQGIQSLLVQMPSFPMDQLGRCQEGVEDAENILTVCPGQVFVGDGIQDFDGGERTLGDCLDTSQSLGSGTQVLGGVFSGVPWLVLRITLSLFCQWVNG
jgi:hypothetical protein